MPVSVTEIAMTERALFRASWSELQPPVTRAISRSTRPWSVNLNAFESMFLMTCWRRLLSVTIERGSAGSTAIENPTPFASATCRNVRSKNSWSSAKRTSPASMTTVPDSIFERSRMSLIRLRRSFPAEWIVFANSVCFGVRLPSWFFESWSERIRRELRGVRSSCDMFARNSDLYFEVSASCFAFSSSAWRACSTSVFFLSTSAFCLARRPAFSPSSWFVFWSTSCCDWSSFARDWDCFRRSSVRVFAWIVLIAMPIVSTTSRRNARCVGLKRSNDASSRTAFTSPSKTTGRTMTLCGTASPRPEPIGM